MDALVADLSARKDSNFRLFGYVGEVNADTEILQERQRSLQVDLGCHTTPCPQEYRHVDLYDCTYVF